MEFIILDKDPAESARLLPCLILKSSIETGVQILSNIGHILGVEWRFQLKPKAARAGETARFMTSKAELIEFTDYLEAYLIDFTSRTGQRLPGHNTFYDAPIFTMTCRLPAGRNEYQLAADRLLQNSGHRFSDHEIKRLKDLL